MAEEKLCPSCEEPVIDKSPPCPLQCMSPKCKSYKKKFHIDSKKKPIIWVLGGPGCGKGTQCIKIAGKYGFTHLSTGDLLRAEVKSGSPRSKCLVTVMEKGELVPTDVVLDLLKEAMFEVIDRSKGFLIDCYPRDKHQGIAFERAIAPCTVILYFEASADTLQKRLMGRAPTSQRSDDNEKAINTRLRTFLTNNEQVIPQYPYKLKRINAEQSAEVIFGEVQKILDPIVKRIAEAEEQEKEKK